MQQELAKEYEHALWLFKAIGLSEEESLIYFYLHNNYLPSMKDISEGLEISERTVKEVLSKLEERKLITIVDAETGKYTVLPPYPIFSSLIHFINQSIHKLQEALPKALHGQLKGVEESKADHKRMKEFQEYLNDIKISLPETIEKEHHRYKELIGGSSIFTEIKDYVLKLYTVIPEIETTASKQLDDPNDLLGKLKSKLEKQFEDEFKIGALTTLASKLLDEFIREHFNEITNQYVEKLKDITNSMIKDSVDHLGKLSESADHVSTDLKIALLTIHTGMKAILNNLTNRVLNVHEEVDAKIKTLTNTFKEAIDRSFKEGTIEKILEYLEQSEQSLRELTKG